ncbi:hypothetical protein JY419_11300 [Stenotrophomonas maltophilia]|nr:hypothetical protein [Stenotrophomonas maltophilia]
MAHGSDFYTKIFSLVVKQAWLADYVNEVGSLFRECEGEEQVELVSDLLDRFTYFSTAREESTIAAMADHIVSLGISSSLLQVVAPSADDDADSGQFVLYALKAELAKRRFGQVQLVNVYGRAQRYVQERPNIVLVDEFVGTGKTLLGRLTTMIREFRANKGVEDAKFYVYAYAGMRSALEELERSGLCKHVHFFSVLDRGISDSYPDAEAALLAMDSLERRLAPKCDGVDLPSLGYGQCEALYGRRGGNCPNSVFPLFWWPENSDSEARQTLLVRKLA